VLHVEDEEDHAKFLEIFLRENDAALEVDSASSAEKALKKLKEKQYDCIVSDYMMPKVNGIKFAEQVKKSHDIPFIIYTGQGSEEVAQAAFTAGVDDYVRKEMDPSHYRVLAKSIRQAVEERSSELLEAERMATAGRVASMVGHDLRSPLQSVKNAVYMITQKPELTPRMLGLIEGAVDRSLKMQDELRQRTREEPLTLAPTNLRKLVEDTARETPHPPKVSIKVEAEGVAKVSVDP
jgi:CheY-like chemotaxis protein